jgi:hypothetical protein
MKICYFTTDWQQTPGPVEGQVGLTYGGTFYYRGAMPATELANHGYETMLSWRFRQEADGHIECLGVDGQWHAPDVLWTQRWMHKDGPEQFRRARAAGQIVIADLDDDFWSLTKTNLAYQSTDPNVNPEFNREHYRESLKQCDLVTVSTEALRRRVESFGVPAIVVRNAVDMRQWQQNDPTSDGMIGWIGGIQWRAHDLEILGQWLPQFLTDYGLPVYHGGDSPVKGVPKFHQKVGIDPSVTMVAYAPLCHIAEYNRLWLPMNISLIPLEKVPFNEAKSWLKQLESCAAGIPYVVSAGLPEQELLIEEGSCGRMARNDKPQEWRAHLEELLDPEVRRNEGAINRSIAVSHDIQRKWMDWDKAYRTVIPSMVSA